MLDERELKIDVFRSKGAGGSGDWAVRITHLPTGVEVAVRGDYAAGESPQPAIDEAAAKLREELEAKLQGLSCGSVGRDA